MSRWTHLMCARCWNERKLGNEVDETAEGGDDPNPCCYCGTVTSLGLYYRSDPTTTKCGAEGPVHADA